MATTLTLEEVADRLERCLRTTRARKRGPQPIMRTAWKGAAWLGGKVERNKFSGKHDLRSIELKYKAIKRERLEWAMQNFVAEMPIQRSPQNSVHTHTALWTLTVENQVYSIRFRKYPDYCTLTVY